MSKFWIINQMDSLPSDGDLKDFVINVHWNRNAKETINNKEYYSSVSGAKSFLKDNVNDFIPYENLTYQIVCSWLDSTLDTKALDLNLDTQIDNQVNPPIVVLPLPFENPTN